MLDNHDFVTATNIVCVNTDFVGGTGIQILFSVLTLVFGLLIPLLHSVYSYVFQGRQNRIHLSFSSALVHMNMFYFVLLDSLMVLLHCRSIGDGYFLWREASIACYEDFQVWALTLGLCTIFISPIATPISVYMFMI